ncbi:MAG: glycosyltransferase family 2 protein [Phycisphaeraceae bacterium]
MRLLIVIVNYRTPDLTIDCLRSLEPEVRRLAGRVHVEVVEGGSGDDSATRIGEAIDAGGYRPWARLRVLECNRGFAAGNNAAIAPALLRRQPPAYVLLLNPDTLVREGALAALVRFMDEHPDVGLAGARIENADGSVRPSAFRFHGVAGEFAKAVRLRVVARMLHRWVIAPPPRDEPHEAEWVSGAAMMVRRAAFQDVGLLDEHYFLYYEEQDFAWRAHQAGWRCWYVPAARVVHLVGQSSGVTGARRAAKPVPDYWFNSRRHFFCKSYGRGYAMLNDFVFLAGFASWRLRRRLQGKPDPDPPRFLRDFIRHSFGTAKGGMATDEQR